MISYISSYENQKHFVQVIEELQLNTMSSFVSNEFDFSDYVKKQAGQIQNSKFLVVDLDAIKSTPEEFLQALNNFRMLYTTKIILVASGHLQGDEYLNHAFCSGIYDIITAQKEEIEIEIKTCILKGKSFKDSLKFQIISNTTSEESKVTTIIREKLIVKNHVKKIANKETIGFIGVQSRTGVTHNTIVCAEYLKESSFSVAIIEIKEERNSDYNKIKEWFEVDASEDNYFRLQDIDFFVSCQLENLHIILSKNYDFFLIDFGTYRKEVENEFIRTAMPIVIGCSKPWEIENMNNIFNSISLEFIKEFYFIFNFTQAEERETIKQNMSPIKSRIFYQEYLEDPFNGKRAGIFQNLLKDYLTEVQISRPKNNLFYKIGGLLKRNDGKEKKVEASDTL